MLHRAERFLRLRRLSSRIFEFRALLSDRNATIYPIPLEISDAEPQKVLVFSPHADDETFGCGGTLIRHRRAGHSVEVICFSDNHGSIDDPGLPDQITMEIRRREFVTAMEALDITQYHFLALPRLESGHEVINRLAKMLVEYQPHVLYVPSMFDNHAEHRGIHTIVEKVLLRVGGRHPRIRLYEVWTALHPNTISDISEFMEQKLAAIESYTSQLDSIDYGHHIAGLNAFRAMTLPRQSGYAEAFFEMSGESYCSFLLKYLR